jgi:hypothetical protein
MDRSVAGSGSALRMLTNNLRVDAHILLRHVSMNVKRVAEDGCLPFACQYLLVG